MKYIVLTAFFVDTEEFLGPIHTPADVMDLAKAMFQGDADFPSDVQVGVAVPPINVQTDDALKHRLEELVLAF